MNNEKCLDLRQKMVDRIDRSMKQIKDDLYALCEAHDDNLLCCKIPWMKVEETLGNSFLVVRTYERVFIDHQRNLMVEINDMVDDSTGVYVENIDNMRAGDVIDVAVTVLI